MKRFNATLNDTTYINVAATRMEIVDNMIRVYDVDDLVAVVDTSVVLSAHISERGELYGRN